MKNDKMKVKIIERTDNFFEAVGFGIAVEYSNFPGNHYASIILTAFINNGTQKCPGLSCRCKNDRELLHNVDSIIEKLNDLKKKIQSPKFNKKLERYGFTVPQTKRRDFNDNCNTRPHVGR